MAEIYRHNSSVTDTERIKVTGQKGAVLWLTGLSGSGKSTIACLAEKMLLQKGINALLLDGDNLRFGLNSNLGFSAEDRSENVRRIACAAALVSESTCVAIVSCVSPFASDREKAAEIIRSAGVSFTEIFVNTSLEECIKRDTKGLYKRAIAGEVTDFTGISSPYEIPDSPDLVLDTVNNTPEECANQVVEYYETLVSLDSMLDSVCDISIQAGKEILNVYDSDFAVEYKEDDSPFTRADCASNRIICDFLKEKYPSVSILSEESKDDLSRLENPLCFIVDPLDGTKEFVKRNGEFTVNIALRLYGKTVLGVVYVPVTDTLYYAAKGCGAFKRTGGTSQRIHVSDRREKLVVMASRSHGDEKLDHLLENNSIRIGEIVRRGSSLKGVLIAEGSADAYYRTGLTSEWDTAAMQCIVEESGGIFRQLDSTPMRYDRKNTLNEKGFYILNLADNKFDF